jgi:pimeloyl-ACP methyl ester carboxylesterase
MPFSAAHRLQSAAMQAPYAPRRAARSEFVGVRGLSYHVHLWGNASLARPERPPLVLLHGWMDVGASFQFMVDALREDRFVMAPDWRGFGLTSNSTADSYWFPDYLGDLDALLDALAPGQRVDLAGHSMGGNVAMIYAGVRPERVRRLINLEGFGMPETQPQEAPRRYAQWLDELKQPMDLLPYDNAESVSRRLLKNNPLLTPDKAAWLALHWSRQRDDGRWHILGDPAHKRTSPVLYRKEEVLACWRCIEAPVLWVEGDRTDVAKWWGSRYPRADFEARLAQVPNVQREVLSPSGHMLHHDQPQALAEMVERFLA